MQYVVDLMYVEAGRKMPWDNLKFAADGDTQAIEQARRWARHTLKMAPKKAFTLSVGRHGYCVLSEPLYIG